MRIVVDMQGVQKQICSSNMRQTLIEFAKAIVRYRGEHDVVLMLSCFFPASIDTVRGIFEGLLPQENIRVWYAPGAKEKDGSFDNEFNHEVVELLYEGFLASLKPDLLHVFDDCFSRTAASFESFSLDIPVTATFHNSLDLKELENFAEGYDEAHEGYDRIHVETLEKIFILTENFNNTSTDCLNLNKSTFLSFPLLPESEISSGKKRIYNICASKAFTIWISLDSEREKNRGGRYERKLKIAYVSPFPPSRTGIADYSAELLPALSTHYDIELIVDQENFNSNHTKSSDYNLKSANWLRKHHRDVDRVVYQIGNSSFHQYMLQLIKDIPGTLVLHDFYLGHLRHWMAQSGHPHEWKHALYNSHGYGALINAYADMESAKVRYPVNWDLLRHAHGVIVHSEFARNLGRQWYGHDVVSGWRVIPLLRQAADKLAKPAARDKLNINHNDFLVCSFGFLGPTKLNHRLLEAWAASGLSMDKCCHLIFVGGGESGEYGHSLSKSIRASGLVDQVRITGFVSSELYREYLSAADVAVQLRADSRGETSAAVLDSMNYGLPLITNANGSISELDSQSVYMLEDNFSRSHLVDALENLREDTAARESLGACAEVIIRNMHSPERCAEKYFEAIESFNYNQVMFPSNTIDKIANHNLINQDSEIVCLAEAISENYPLRQPAKRIFLDITGTHFNNLKTGIERVAQSLIFELINAPPDEYRIEPVYLENFDGQWRYVYAREYTLSFMRIRNVALNDDVADMDVGDIVLGLDISGTAIIQSVHTNYIQALRNKGVKVYFFVHDLIPVRLPSVFPPGADKAHHDWLSAVAATDGVIGVTKHVAEDFRSWLNETGIHSNRERDFKIDYSHHGADITSNVTSVGIPFWGRKILRKMTRRPSFLMVGSIEPRKNYLTVIKAFERLWEKDLKINLVIVGREGWCELPNDFRRDIPETVQSIKSHSRNGKNLFWLEGVSDEFLNKIYDHCTCLIAASHDEGFGLPLIEAAQHKIPIIASDIPVFREVAKDYAFYINNRKPDAIAQSIYDWLELYREKKHPCSDDMPWLTWKESAQRLLKTIID